MDGEYSDDIDGRIEVKRYEVSMIEGRVCWEGKNKGKHKFALHTHKKTK